MSSLFHSRALLLILALVTLVGVDTTIGQRTGDGDVSSILTLLLGCTGLLVAADMRRRALGDGRAKADAWTVPGQTPAAMVIAAQVAADGELAHAPGAMIRLSVTPLADTAFPLSSGETDRLIHVVMERARRTLRADDVVTRLGLLDVAISLHGRCQEDVAMLMAERLRDTLLEPVALDRRDVPLAPRIGVAVAGVSGDTDVAVDVETLLRRADEARGLATAEGRSVVVWTDEHSEVSLRRSELSGRLRRALRVGDISLVYQPIHGVEEGRITTVEALARWDDVRFGPVSPVEFVGLCESLGLTPQLMRLVLDQAVAQVVEWRKGGLDIGVHVNVSGLDVAEDRLPIWVTDALAKHGCPAELLTLEITETAVIANPDRVLPTLHALRDSGVHLSLDDYGTGYSSLLYIQQMPIESLKIDQAFLANLMNSPSDEVIVRTSIELAHALGLRVTVEGVEDRATMDRAIEFGTDNIQGYYVGRPASAAHIASTVAAWQG